MKVQIKKFSTHQTAKVFALLMVASSLCIVIPLTLLSSMLPNSTGAGVPAVGFSAMFLVLPIVHGVMGYIMMRFGLWLYNALYPKIGGIEFDYESLEG